MPKATVSLLQSVVATLVLSSLVYAQQTLYGQCGGIGWTGATTCVSGSYCQYSNDWYSQCVPGTASSTSTTKATSTTTSKTTSSTGSTSTTSCQASADGFASLNGGTTGGNGGTVVTVSTQADLESYAAASGKYVIKVKGKITISPFGKEINVASDKTIVGIGSDAEIYQGGLHMDSVHNIIIRNLKIGGTYIATDYEGKTQDYDAIQMDSCSNIWIDHCHLEAAGDGLIDSRLDTTFLTVSWTILRNHNKAFGIGWTDNVTSQITIHHCWFHNTNQRNPSADNIKYAHLYNNYLKNVTSYGHYSRGSTQMRMENVYFESVKNPVTRDDTASLAASGNTYQSCSGTTAANSGSVFTASSYYQYTLDSTSNIPSVVSAGAGRQASICPS
ncbi:pectin lyase-like protein [Serendipita vermifera]|nr:pectin lyase-like protein [Serendipita vermifera]